MKVFAAGTFEDWDDIQLPPLSVSEIICGLRIGPEYSARWVEVGSPGQCIMLGIKRGIPSSWRPLAYDALLRAMERSGRRYRGYPPPACAIAQRMLR